MTRRFLTCLRCGWVWVLSARLRAAEKLPRVCPKCKRADWNKRRPMPVGGRYWHRAAVRR